jgi:hypothetical protein
MNMHTSFESAHPRSRRKRPHSAVWLINTIYILSAMLLSCVLSRVVYANNVPPHVPRGTWGGTLPKGTQAT